MAEATHDNTALLFVGCYTKFDDLAHAPRGTPSDASIYTYSLDKSSGKLKHVRSLSGAFAAPGPVSPKLNLNDADCKHSYNER
eukprot:4660237-Pleurochrysis_carterae.AAC.1